MNQHDPNRESLVLAALKLEPFLNEIVFLGGATVGLLIAGTDIGRIRITRDVDVIVEVAGRREFHQLESRLRNAGFKPDTSEAAPICRWLIEGLMIDVMPTDETILGFSNRWYRIAVQQARSFTLADDLVIRLVTPACFLATKIEAFSERGNNDYLASHDFEDIVTIVSGREDILDEIAAAPVEIRNYIAREIAGMTGAPDFRAAIEGIVAPRMIDLPLADTCIERMRRITQWDTV